MLLYKGEAFPFDSGVAYSYAQYAFLLRQSRYLTALNIARDAQITPRVVVLPPLSEESPAQRKKTRVALRSNFWTGFAFGAATVAIGLFVIH